MARILSVFLAFFVTSASVATLSSPVEFRVAKSRCTIEGFVVKPRHRNAVADALAGLQTASDAIDGIARALVTKQAVPTNSRRRISKGLYHRRVALSRITDVNAAAAAAQGTLQSAFEHGRELVEACIGEIVSECDSTVVESVLSIVYKSEMLD
ncbi:hypothetical protein C8R44DRAFT_889338 [Mycena epipterygia]|nr:hypothetical protein C8R44DRAFT_889338 [Mycena epipterygia]